MKFLDTFAFPRPLFFPSALPTSNDKMKPQRLLARVRFSLFSLLEQTLLLLWKTFLVLSRHQLSIWSQLIAPVFVCLFVFSVQTMTDRLLNRYVDLDPAAEAINQIPKCLGDQCITLGVGYTDGEAAWTQHVLSHVARQQNFALGRDIVKLGEDYDNMMKFFSQHPNKTQAAIIFCTGTVRSGNFTALQYLPCAGNDTHVLMAYSIILNFSSVNFPTLIKPDEKSPVSRTILPYKVAVDNGILDFHRLRKGLPEMKFEVEMSDYPHIKHRMAANFDTVTLQGPLYFFLPPMIIFMLVATEMVREKEQNLRKCLCVLGISQTAYWLSWLLVGLFFSFFMSNAITMAGRMMDFDLFVKTPYNVLILLFFTFANTMIMLAFFLVTILASGKIAYTATYSLLLGGLVLQGFISSHLLLICLHLQELPGWLVFVRKVLRMYPPFNFSTAFFEVARRSSWHPQYSEQHWASGEGYQWQHFFEGQRGTLKGYAFATPSLYDSLAFLCGDFLFFAVLAWFCDNVIENNRGVGQPLWFMFTRRYWGWSSTQREEIRTPYDKRQSDRDNVEEEVERVKLLQREDSSSDGIHIANLSKVYRKHSLCGKSSSEVVALSDLYLSAERDEVLTLLGHNGAGKSTLLSILSGTLGLTSGTATVCGLDIRHDMSEIRKKMGFCPQHNLLWEELTAEEHIYLFSRLKGYSPSQAQKSTATLLQEVELTHVAKARVGTFSGGMQRRISIALAGTGNPDVILMDEPTTGLDIISRSQVWKLVQRFKRNRIVILTTHSMEEADALSDRIAVMVSGSLKCIGSSLYLKNRFGSGYRVSLLTSQRATAESLIRAAVPTAVIKSESDDSLVVALPKDDIDTAANFFQLIEGGQLAPFITDWGISNTSLEQVFLQVTGGASLSVGRDPRKTSI